MNQLERGALLASRLIEGVGLTATEAAELTGVSLRTAQRDLSAIGRVLAIDQDEHWRWRRADRSRAMAGGRLEGP